MREPASEDVVGPDIAGVAGEWVFGSAACRAEVARFGERELGRADLILPMYYISAVQMDAPAVRECDEMARVLASRQFADWRELRFEPLASPPVRRAVAQLASRIRDTFWPGPVPPGPAAGRGQQAGATAVPAGRAGAGIVIRARGADALSFRANIGRVANLTLRQAGGEGHKG